MSEQSISAYLDELGSKDGLPGGGSAANLVGAMGASLARMVADIQKGKKKYIEKQSELKEILEKAEALRSQFENLSEKDAQAFEPVSKAYQLPKKTEEEKVKRKQAIDEALKKAAMPPLESMKRVIDVIQLYKDLTTLGIKGSIVNDIAVGVLFSRTALEASYLNVLVNAEMLWDEEAKVSLEGRSQAYLVQGLDYADELYAEAKYYLTHKKWPESKDRGEQV